MLVMTLKEHDFIMIGKDIRIQFMKDPSSDGIRIGIEAPRSLEIARSKVYEKALSENPASDPNELAEVKARRKAAIIERQKKQKRIGQNNTASAAK